MRKRPIMKVRPGLEPLEEKRPLSVNASTAPFVNLKAGSGPWPPPADTPGAPGAVGASRASSRRADGSPPVLQPADAARP